ncbi:MerR family transcriptional regulator [Microbacterium sp. dk485]|uniref:helix-turn-helix domain-containing protein n=1 Tax=Microbacterium sp. dk485 TaxID=2560021 RepID=UPI00107305A5|nr:helix-turn-helix domain-containing protein [Microbacterium sp. dk485]TFV82030.1 MerR family transcriptional regulator [Microbacterium sp. dk485]
MADPITSRDVAKITGATQSTVNRWVKAGLLKPIFEMPGYRGARLFDPDDVQQLARERANA